MKLRIGFISNSSVSSFICDVCGEEYAGMDVSPSDCDCSRCKHDHIYCNSHADEEDFIDPCDDCSLDEDQCEGCENRGGRYEETDDGYYIEGSYGRNCPVCAFKVLAPEETSLYLEKEHSISRAAAFAEVKKANPRRRKLYDSEYIDYVCQQKGITKENILSELKSRFGTYDKFMEYMG